MPSLSRASAEVALVDIKFRPSVLPFDHEHQVADAIAMGKIPALAALVALTHECRLEMLRLLGQAGECGIPVGQIGKHLGLRGPLVSFHLKQLRDAGLVRFRREGRTFIYAIENSAITGLMAYLSETCCLSASDAQPSAIAK
jgi:ArsR family transcriptional regulator